MAKARGWVCAAAGALLFLAGCASDYFNLTFLASTSSGRDRVFTGSLESVTQSTQAALRQLSIATDARPEGDAVRIYCTTKDSKRFVMVLTREKSEQGEHTRVRLEWDKGSDDQLGMEVLSLVASLRTR
jgi:hypothetical protein